jgi:hypothetical protein
LNVADTPETAREFLERYGWDWPQIEDPERRLARSIGADYQPHVILFDANGRFVGRFEGGGTAADWEDLAARLSSS